MRNLKILLATIVISLALNSEARDKVLLVADTWCPFNCDPTSASPGLLVEVAKIAFDKINMDVDYQIRPWNQDVADFNDGKVDGLIGAGDGDTQDPVFPSVEQARSMVSAYTLNDKSWAYDGTSSFDNKILGIIEGYNYANDIKQYIFSNYVTQPDNFIFSTADDAIDDNIKKLQSGTTFVYIEDENVVNNYSIQHNITNIRNAGSVQKDADKIYIAFPKQKPNSEKYAKLMTDTTFELKSNGKYADLIKKYNLKTYDNLNAR